LRASGVFGDHLFNHFFRGSGFAHPRRYFFGFIDSPGRPPPGYFLAFFASNSPARALL
jgi:hypothetical protein